MSIEWLSKIGWPLASLGELLSEKPVLGKEVVAELKKSGTNVEAYEEVTRQALATGKPVVEGDLNRR